MRLVKTAAANWMPSTSLQRQRVRRHFHDAGACATMSRMKACRSGASGVVRVVEGAIADAIRDRAHQAALDAGGVELR